MICAGRFVTGAPAFELGTYARVIQEPREVSRPRESGNDRCEHNQHEKLAKECPDVALTTLAHHIDVSWLREAYRRTRKDGSRGVDGVSAQQYEQRLDENLVSLLGRMHTGRYHAPPLRRVLIPKEKGGQRPIGVPTFEDKVLQRAVAMVLEAIYETSFYDFSYGLPAWPVGASSARSGAERGGAIGRRVDLGSRHSKVFRHPRSRSPPSDSSPTDT